MYTENSWVGFGKWGPDRSQTYCEHFPTVDSEVSKSIIMCHLYLVHLGFSMVTPEVLCRYISSYFN